MLSQLRLWRGYNQVPGSEGEHDDNNCNEKYSYRIAALPRQSTQRLPYWHIAYGLAILLMSALSSSLAFALGRYSTWPIPPDSGRVNGVGTELTHFKYNHTFAKAPSHDSNSAWGSIFPPHNGFFHDAEIAPYGASLSAFHQLHCLDGMRHAFYIMYEAVKHGESVDLDHLEEPFTLHHTQHCIDFLRQKIMCNADLGIEWVGPELNGIVGFGIDHQCTRWHEVHAWVIDKQTRWDREQALLKRFSN